MTCVLVRQGMFTVPVVWLGIASKNTILISAVVAFSIAGAFSMPTKAGERKKFDLPHYILALAAVFIARGIAQE